MSESIKKPNVDFEGLRKKLLKLERVEEEFISCNPKNRNFSHRKKVAIKRVTRALRKALDPYQQTIDKLFFDKYTEMLINGESRITPDEIDNILKR